MAPQLLCYANSFSSLAPLQGVCYPSGMAKVSVIIPTFNRSPLLGRALDSVFNQSFKDFDVWVVDDASTDSTKEDLEKILDPRLSCLFNKTNKGVSFSRNKAIQASQGEWLALLDSDDQWLPEKLQMQWDWVQKNPKFLFLHNDEIWIRNHQRVNPMKKHAKKGGRIFMDCLPLCCISPSASFIHRSLFDQLGFFREDFPVCEDYEFWLRIAAKYEIGFMPEALTIKHGGHADQLSRRHFAMDYWRVKALYTFLSSKDLSLSEKRALTEMIISKSNILIQGYKKHENLEPLPEIEALREKAVRYLDTYGFALEASSRRSSAQY